MHYGRKQVTLTSGLLGTFNISSNAIACGFCATISGYRTIVIIVDRIFLKTRRENSGVVAFTGHTASASADLLQGGWHVAKARWLMQLCHALFCLPNLNLEPQEAAFAWFYRFEHFPG